jgi:hypothetical protein
MKPDLQRPVGSTKVGTAKEDAAESVFSIPLAENPTAIGVIKSLAIREAANQEKILPPPNACLSCLCVSTSLSLRQLSNLANRDLVPKLIVQARVDEPPVLHKSGKIV